MKILKSISLAIAFVIALFLLCYAIVAPLMGGYHIIVSLVVLVAVLSFAAYDTVK